ncbi:type III secretion system protein SctP [Paraburkholderia hayleyella]|uniref:type III secretion system protein SctP n=1 Tax=Paraburkholderia hayleyella TaxID=2152889 RepID=UPI001292AB3B|nr:type III secretion system protein SctP [Paraburkholderia hayleyella]
MRRYLLHELHLTRAATLADPSFMPLRPHLPQPHETRHARATHQGKAASAAQRVWAQRDWPEGLAEQRFIALFHAQAEDFARGSTACQHPRGNAAESRAEAASRRLEDSMDYADQSAGIDDARGIGTLDPDHSAAPRVSCASRSGAGRDTLDASHLATRIASFCQSPTACNGGNWDISLELDPAIVPHTRLHLKLSPGALLLRFDVRSSHACTLLSNARDALGAHLEARLERRIEIEIDPLDR